MKPILLVGLLVASLTACHSYRPTPPLPAPATTVRVSFLSPRDVVARTPAGDSVVLSGVRELNGSIVRAQLDTRVDSMRVRVASARNTSGGIEGIPDGAVVTVPREPFVRVEQKSIDPVKTFRAVALAVGVVTLVAVVLIGMAFDTADY